MLSQQKIANILDVNVKTVEFTLSKWHANGLKIHEDQRQGNGLKKMFSVEQIEMFTSHEVLQRQASMTLIERSQDIMKTF